MRIEQAKTELERRVGDTAKGGLLRQLEDVERRRAGVWRLRIGCRPGCRLAELAERRPNQADYSGLVRRADQGTSR